MTDTSEVPAQHPELTGDGYVKLAELATKPGGGDVTVPAALLQAAVAEIRKLRTTAYGWHDAGLDVWNTWDRYVNAKSPLDAASLLVELNNDIAQLGTWLPGYDYESGTIPEEGE